MKKLMLILVVAMAVPAMAMVNFSAEVVDGNLVISYASDAGEMPRGIALRVEGATADPAAPGEMCPAFNAFVDYAYYAFNAGMTYDLADNKGHALADPTAAGVLAAPADVFSISAGVLDETGNQGAGPESCVLITLPITCGEGDITISADTLRGPDSGVVGSVLESNLPITVECGETPPLCWSYPCQPYGDTDGDGDTDAADVGVAVGGWNDYNGTTNGIPNLCADTDKDGDVDAADIGMVVQGWNGACPQ